MTCSACRSSSGIRRRLLVTARQVHECCPDPAVTGVLMTLIAQLSDTHITTGLGVEATDRAREAMLQVQAMTPWTA